MRTSRKTFNGLIGMFIMLCVSFFASAGTVYLTDGSILKGEIKLLRDDQLTLQTRYAGELELPRSQVSGLETEEAMTVVLNNGEELQARLTRDAQGNLSLAHDAGPTQTIVFAQVFDLRPVGAPAAGTAAAQDEAELDGPWSGSLQAGVSGSSGNSDNQNIDVRAATKRETENNRLSLEALLNKASQNDQQTEDEIRGTARLEQDVSKRAFVFGEFEAERDQFEDVDVRYRATVGPGYFFLEEPDHVLKARLGLGFEQERFEDADTNNNFVLTLGYDYRVDLWEWFRLTHKFTAIPDIGDEPSKNYRLESALGGELPLGSKDSLWRLRGEYRHEYDNNPEAGVEDLDTNYLLSIIRDFE